jgi:hypothetical protein
VPARKKQDVSADLAYAAYNAIGAACYLLHRFTPRATVSEQLPVRVFRADLRRAQPFILTVVPFNQIGVNFSDGSEAS